MVELKDVSTKDCEERLRKNPNSLIFSRLADCYRKRGDIQQAIDVCSRGLANHPDSITGRIILGRCYLEQEKYKEASIEFIKVIEQDRRNQVALKMLADVFTHQGMKEKAGDLYQYLSAIDPENQSIVNLAAAGGGSGVKNIYRILGFSEQAQARMVLPTRSDDAPKGDIFIADEKLLREVSPFPDTEDAFAQTIQMDPEELKKEAVRPDDEFAQTMEFDAEELNTAMQQKDSGIEEVVGDLPETGDVSVTGDDISARMSMMFKEESPPAEIASGPVEQSVEDNSQKYEEFDTDRQTDLGATPETIPEVSGSDISNRIEQLFGESGREETPATEQTVAGDYTQLFDSSPPVAEPEPALTSQDLQDEPIGTQEGKPPDVSGEDIVMRMSEMFEKSGDDAGPIGSVLEAEETIANEPENIIPMESAPGEMVSLEPGIAALSGTTEASDSSGAPPAPDTPEIAEMLKEDAISGDDIAQRLETIFEEEEASSISSPLPSMEDEAAPDVTKESEPSITDTISLENMTAPDGVQAPEAEDIQEINDDDIVPFIEQMAPEAQRGEGMEADGSALGASKEPLQKDISEPVDDAMPEEEVAGMSGDDVRSRLDEIFPEELISEEKLSMVDEIPEGEKGEERPNQGFYTMSGEDAVAAVSDEKLLNQLDDVEIEIPVAEKSQNEHSSIAPLETGIDRTEAAVTIEDDSQDDLQQGAGQPEDGRLNAIPDHVLTPTLADIYFQQGQPQLAIQIYSRLLQKDPDNEKIAQRIEEIKEYIAENPPEAASSIRDEIQQAAPKKTKKRSSSSKKGMRNKSSAVPKPLAGVRIKKKKKSAIGGKKLT